MLCGGPYKYCTLKYTESYLRVKSLLLRINIYDILYIIINYPNCNLVSVFFLKSVYPRSRADTYLIRYPYWYLCNIVHDSSRSCSCWTALLSSLMRKAATWMGTKVRLFLSFHIICPRKDISCASQSRYQKHTHAPPCPWFDFFGITLTALMHSAMKSEHPVPADLTGEIR
jgi:hypothetical protein